MKRWVAEIYLHRSGGGIVRYAMFNNTHKGTSSSLIVALFLLFAVVSDVSAQGTVFTYQGKLTDAGNAANGSYEMQFKLFDTAIVGTGSQQGPTFIYPIVQVASGIFTVQLDFGPGIFSGQSRYLEIGVRPAGSTNPYTLLAPRQQVTPTPYSIRSNSAAVADTAMNAAQLGGLPPTGFIQNRTSQQGVANFNIGGDGTLGGVLSANVVNAATQYSIAGARVLSVPGNGNTFAGVEAGQSNTGTNNSFFGNQAGITNTQGSANSFFGKGAGLVNTSGTQNSFFGVSAGGSNVSGDNNSFFGALAGSITNASDNSFFGSGAGRINNTGDRNSFFGRDAGRDNSSGTLNTFIGASAGASNTTGGGNTFVGAFASGAPGITNATAIGSVSQVSQSNSLVLGSISGTGTRVGIGITAPSYRLHVIDQANAGLRVQTDSSGGSVASFGGLGDFQIDASGVPAGRFVVTQSGNVGIGTPNPTSKLQVIGNATISGTLSKGGGSFKIDHPLDPENRFLFHSFVESPDMMNIYNGVVVLNNSGESIITLPAYFEALNKDFRYQLTAIGKSGPNLYIAREINGNQFKIAGGKPGLKVSWQVTGIRKDAYANAHRIQVEEDKPLQERGTLLHPDAFNKASTGRALSAAPKQRRLTLAGIPHKQTAGR